VNGKEREALFPSELDDEDRWHIRMVFQETVVPRLYKMGARVGVVNCSFAGKQYGSWNVRFESAGGGFEIVDFEFDEDADGIDLDL
jgi:hypothetical protein